MANLISLSKLFDNNIFRIPDYQRGYAWEKEQLEDFWQDLNNLTDTTLHYTGMISKKEINELSKEEKWALGNNKAYHIVDGQQRLTTCIIFINELIKYAQKNNLSHIKGENLEDIKEKYILKQNEEDLIVYVFGYEIDNPSFEYFKYKILGYESEYSQIEESFYTVKMKCAQDFFADKIKDLKKEEIEEIYLKLTNNLMFIDYDISQDFDVYTVFEVMNDRGKPLSNLEKFKNRLIYLTTAFSAERYSDNAKVSLKNIINSSWKEIYKQLGHSKERVLKDDDYLKAHWILYYKYSRNRGDDYIKDLLDKRYTIASVKKGNELFKNKTNLDETCIEPKDIKNYVQSLQSTAKFWYYSHFPDTSDLDEEEKDYIRKLNRIRMGYFRPLVVASMINKQVTPDRRLEFLKTIERFIFIICRMGKDKTEKGEIYKLARELFKEEKSIEDITTYINKLLANSITTALSDFYNTVRANIKKEGYYTNKDFIKYLLFEYEVYLCGSGMAKIKSWADFTKTKRGRISIEHIFPQKPTDDYWQKQFKGYSENQQKILAGSLGNLLPLAQEINSSLQNDDFATKKTGKGNPNDKKDYRRGYEKGSYSEQAVARCVDWSPKEIKNRGLEMLEFMEERWNFNFDTDDKLKLLGIEFIEYETN